MDIAILCPQSCMVTLRGVRHPGHFVRIIYIMRSTVGAAGQNVEVTDTGFARPQVCSAAVWPRRIARNIAVFVDGYGLPAVVTAEQRQTLQTIFVAPYERHNRRSSI